MITTAIICPDSVDSPSICRRIRCSFFRYDNSGSGEPSITVARHNAAPIWEFRSFSVTRASISGLEINVKDQVHNYSLDLFMVAVFLHSPIDGDDTETSPPCDLTPTDRFQSPVAVRSVDDLRVALTLLLLAMVVSILRRRRLMRVPGASKLQSSFN